MKRLSRREAVTRISLTLGAGFSASIYAVAPETGPALFAPAAVPLLFGAMDAHKSRKEGDAPDGVRMVD